MERTATDLCLLCCEKPADKKGSHIIPAFIISSALNLKGSNARDKEFMVMFRNKGFAESHFGRNVLPEAIEQVKSTQLEQESNNNPNVRDFFFCSDCEKKLGLIENLFAQEVYKPLNEKKFKSEKSEKEYDIVTIEKSLSHLATLFFLSVIWRIAIAKYMKLRISEQALGRLRKALHSCLDIDIKCVTKKIEENKDSVCRFPIVALYSAKLNDPTKGIIYCDGHKTPHFIIINQFILFFYEKEGHLRASQNTFFGLTDLIDKRELVNYMSDTLKIGVLNESQVDSSQTKVLEMLKDETLKDIRIRFSKGHELVFGFRPPSDVVYALAHRIHFDNSALFDHYTDDNITEHMIQFLAEIFDFTRKYNQYPRLRTEDGKIIEVKMP